MGIASAAAAAAAALALASPAFAATVTGADAYLSDATRSFDALSVNGDAGETIYVDVESNGRKVASHLAYTLPGDGRVSGTVSISADSLDPDGGYVVRAYADRAEERELYTGRLSLVYGDVGGKRFVIGTRVTGGEERGFTPPRTVSVNGTVCTLASDEAVTEDPLTYAYEPDPGEATGHVSFVDGDGNVVATHDVEVGDGPVTYDVPSTVDGEDGRYWVVSTSPSVTLSRLGQMSYSLRVEHMADAEANGYTADVRLVADDGTVLAVDRVPVDRTYRYTAPSSVSALVDGEVRQYSIDGDRSITLAPNADDAGKVVERTFSYARDAGDDATWTVRLIDGSKAPSDAGRVIATRSFSVGAGRTQTIEPDETLDVSGKVYRLASAGSISYTAGSGDWPYADIYYVPDGYAPDEEYAVTVRYVDAATKRTIELHDYTMSPDRLEDARIATPASLVAGNRRYVRLGGQEDAISHGYFMGRRTYTVWYRDVNDDLHSEATVTRIRVRYTDGGTTYTPGEFASSFGGITGMGASVAGRSRGANGTDRNGTDRNGAGGNAAGNGAGNISIGGDGDGLSTVDAPDGTTVGDDGGTPAEERIESEQTPLSTSEGGRRAMPLAGIVGIAGVAALLIAIIAVLGKRKKEDGWHDR